MRTMTGVNMPRGGQKPILTTVNEP